MLILLFHLVIISKKTDKWFIIPRAIVTIHRLKAEWVYPLW